MEVEDIEDTTDDRLMNFLYKVKDLKRFTSIREMFNVPFDLAKFIDGFSSQIQDSKDIFFDLTKDIDQGSHGRDNGSFQ